MSEHFPTAQPQDALEHDLRARLAQGDQFIVNARPILRQLVAEDDQSLFSDEVIACIRGMLTHCVRQVLHVLAEASQTPDRDAFFDDHTAPMAKALMVNSAFLGHAHALVMENHLTERLQQRSGIDPVLSPLLQELTASSDPAIAAQAMHVLAAQARFVQQQRRMECPLSELPGDLLHELLQVMQSQTNLPAEVLDAAQHQLRLEYDESRRRVGQLTRLVIALGRKASRALSIDHAGLAIFITALAMASEQSRELATMALYDNQTARLALSLLAAGLDRSEIEKQFLYLHPGIALPEGISNLRTDKAQAILAASGVDMDV